MVTKETNGGFLFGYLVGVAWKLLLRKRVLGAFRRFVAPPALQLHPRLFCCKKRERRHLCGCWGRLAPYFRAVDTRTALYSPSHSPCHQCLALSPELLPCAVRTPAFAVRLPLAHCPQLFHSPSPSRCPGTCSHWSPIPALRPEASPTPQLIIVAVTPHGHWPGPRQGHLFTSRISSHLVVTVETWKWVLKTCWTCSRSQSRLNEEQVCGTPESGLPRHYVEQVS